MSETGWPAVCISEGPFCRPDYPAPRPPGLALHLRSKTGQVAEGLTSAAHRRNTGILSQTDVLGRLQMYLHEQWRLSTAYCMYYSSSHSWGVKAIQPVEKKCDEQKKYWLLWDVRKQYQNWNQTDRPLAFFCCIPHTTSTFSRHCIMGMGGERSREDSNNLFTSLCLTLTTKALFHAVPIIMVFSA